MKNAAILLAILCLLLPTTLFSQILINEFYADVALGDVGDANGDGVRNASEDEFIEIVNPSNELVIIEGYTIWVSGILRHKFETNALGRNSAIVIFGGGEPSLYNNSKVVLASSGSLGLGNSGAKVELKNPQGEIVEEFIYPDEDINSSWARDPDITGGFKAHLQIIDAYGLPFSPGTFNNGFPYNSPPDQTLVQFHQPDGLATEGDSLLKIPIHLINPSITKATIVTINFAGGSVPSVPISNNFLDFNNTFHFPPNEQGLQFFTIPIIEDTIVEMNTVYIFSIDVEGGNNAMESLQGFYTVVLEDNDFDFPLLLNEIHADPAQGLEGDANGDGARDAIEDEFLEFINTSDQVVDISNLQLWDAIAMRHDIPEETKIAPNQAYVVFGGGLPSGDFGNAIVQTASTGRLSLANEGDKIVLKDDTTNSTVYAYVYTSTAANNQSITRYPDLEGDLHTLHSTVGNGALFSPGKNVEAADFSMTVPSYEELVGPKITVYPNPSSGSFYVESALPFRRIEVFNGYGQLVLVTKEQRMELEAGIYFLRIYTSEGWVVKKVEVF